MYAGQVRLRRSGIQPLLGNRIKNLTISIPQQTSDAAAATITVAPQFLSGLSASNLIGALPFVIIIRVIVVIAVAVAVAVAVALGGSRLLHASGHNGGGE